jgi:hypothetical protein
MSGLTNIDAVYIALVFIVPGYIFLTLRNRFVAGQDRLGTEQILSFVTYSSLNFAMFGWMIYLAISYQLAPYIRVAIWLLTLVVIPAGLGLLCGVSSQKEIVMGSPQPSPHPPHRSHHLPRIEPQHLRQLQKFHDIDTALAAFEARYEGSRFAEPVGQLRLRHTGGFTALDQEGDQDSVTFRSECCCQIQSSQSDLRGLT